MKDHPHCDIIFENMRLYKRFDESVWSVSITGVWQKEKNFVRLLAMTPLKTDNNLVGEPNKVFYLSKKVLRKMDNEVDNMIGKNKKRVVKTKNPKRVNTKRKKEETVTSTW